VRRTFGKVATAEHRRLTRDLFVACTPEARGDFLAAMGAMDLTAGLASIRVPTVVLVGTLDRLTPPEHADVMAAGIPGARLVRYEGRGHQLPLEAPDEVAQEIRNLL
jgi:pimeloyl-ACP methyl ester carboxylesterase